MKKPSPLILALGVVLAVSGALFAQSRNRRTTRSDSPSWGGGPSGPMTNGTGPGFTANSPKPGQPLPGDFAILEEKSIFEKDRHISRPQLDTEPPRTEPTPPRIEVPRPPAIPVFIGTMIGDDGLIGYIEDPDNGAIWPLAPNDTLPAPYGSVKDITLDYMDITPPDGKTRRILIGQNLTGDAPPPPSSSSHYSPSELPSATGPASTQGATTGPALDPNDPNVSIEERMKRRRQQQLGK